MWLATEDALGRAVRLPAPPRRIVSLVPSVTETLSALGLDEEVVGLTTFCVRPPGWRERKARVGGTKQVRLGRVAALRPDLILANQEENTRQDVEALADLAPVHVSRVASVAEALDYLRTLGRLVDRAPAGEALAEAVGAGFAGLTRVPPLRVAYLIWRRPWMTVGGDTFISDLLARGGLLNVFGARRRYPELSAAELAAEAPQAVLLPSEPFPFAEEHRAEVAAAAPGARVLLVDGERCSWWGSRLLEAPAALRAVREALTGPAGGAC